MVVYVNWDTCEVLGQEQTDEAIDRKCKEYIDDECSFMDWLQENFTFGEMWEMDDELKVKVREDYEKTCREDAEDWFDTNFEEYRVH